MTKDSDKSWMTDESIWGDHMKSDDWVYEEDNWEDDPVFKDSDLKTELPKSTANYADIIKRIAAENDEFMKLSFKERTDWGE